MIKVYIWKAQKQSNGKKLYGHVSMEVRASYVSWWPISEPYLPLGRYMPYRTRTFDDDVAGEGGSQPDNVIHLNGGRMDEGKIVTWWNRFRYNNNYILGTKNCSSVVAEGLRVGGATRYTGPWASHNFVWTPKKMLTFAMKLHNAITRRG